jgi:TonB family protein
MRTDSFMICSWSNYPITRAAYFFVSLAFLISATDGFAATAAKDDSLPPSEQKFCSAVVKYSEICRQAEDSGANAIKLESIRKDLTTALRKAAGPRDTILKGWVGKVASIGTTSSGQGTLDIELPCLTTLSSSSSEDSDSMDAAGPLDPSSKAFAAAAQLKEGQQISFSGSFLSDWGYAFNELGSGNTCHGDAFVLLFKFSGLGPPEAQRAAVRASPRPKTAPIVRFSPDNRVKKTAPLPPVGARAIYAPVPVIPDDLREDLTQTEAVARFKVTSEGTTEVTLEKATSNPRLDQVLLDTLKQWKFSPAMKDGVAVESSFEVRIPISVR